MKSNKLYCHSFFGGREIGREHLFSVILLKQQGVSRSPRVELMDVTRFADHQEMFHHCSLGLGGFGFYFVCFLRRELESLT